MGSLDPAIIEMQMMVRLNKDMKSLDPAVVPNHPKDWKAFIPARPLLDSDMEEAEDDNEDDEEDLDNLEKESDEEEEDD